MKMEDSNIIELNREKNDVDKKNILRYLKFFLIPGWRDPILSQREDFLDDYLNHLLFLE